MCSCHGNSPYCSNENSWPFCFTAKNELNPMSWHIGCDGKSLWDGVLVSNHYTKYYHHHTGLKVEFLWCSLHFCHINIYIYNIYLYIYIYSHTSIFVKPFIHDTVEIIIIIIIIIIILIIIVIIDFVLKPQWFLFHVTPNI